MFGLRSALFSFVDHLSRRQKQVFLLLVDVFLAPLALLLALCAALGALPSPSLMSGIWALFPALSVLAAVVSTALRLPNLKLNAFETSAILRAGFFAALVMAGLFVLIRQTDTAIPASGTILFGLIFFLLSVAVRCAMLHVLLWVLRAGQARCRVVIYGAGSTGMQLAAALQMHDTIFPVAFVDDDPALHSISVGGLRIFAPDKIGCLAKTLKLDRVILAMPSVSAPIRARIARKLQARGLTVMTLPSFAQLVGMEAMVDTLAPVSAGQFLGRCQIDDTLPENADSYRGRTVLISGAGGSIGAELCRQLLASRLKRIVLFEMSEIALYTIERELRDLAEGTDVEIVVVIGSVTDARMTRMVMEENRVDVVFHAAAYKHVPMVEANPIAGLSNNVLGTRTLAEAARQSGVKQFVLISTDKAVRPTNVMGASKRLAELVVQDMAKRPKDTMFSMVRFGNVLGSSGSVIPLFKDQIARGGPVTLTHEDVARYFMTLEEAARLVLLAGSYARRGHSKGGDVFVLDMGAPVRIRKLAEQMIGAAGYTVRDASRPDGDIEIVVTGLRPGEKLHEELLIGEGLLPTGNPKILRAEEQSLSELQMATALRALREAVSTGDAEAARLVIQTYVEGYQPPGWLLAAQKGGSSLSAPVQDHCHAEDSHDAVMSEVFSRPPRLGYARTATGSASGNKGAQVNKVRQPDGTMKAVAQSKLSH